MVVKLSGQVVIVATTETVHHVIIILKVMEQHKQVTRTQVTQQLHKYVKPSKLLILNIGQYFGQFAMIVQHVRVTQSYNYNIHTTFCLYTPTVLYGYTQHKQCLTNGQTFPMELIKVCSILDGRNVQSQYTCTHCW